MKLYEFLAELLKTHGIALQRLAAFFGEEQLFEILENLGEKLDESPLEINIESEWFDTSSPSNDSQAYKELEWAVREIHLPSILEFHLWAYPPYRALIESSIPLGSEIRVSEDHLVHPLIEEAIEQAKLWSQQLPISPQLSSAAERAVEVAWIRFRSDMLRKIGKRPMVSI